VDNLLRTIYKNIIAFLFPIKCLKCGRVGKWFCEDCAETLRPVAELHCLICQRPALGGFTHVQCRTRNNPERIICYFDFHEKVVSRAIHLLKYKGYVSLVSEITNLITSSLEENGVSFGEEAVIVPVPLHPVKKLLRGFNQSELLANELARSLGLEARSDLVERVRDTPSQTELKKEARKENVAGAFSATDENFIKGRDFIVFDDVYTTGATILEVCRVLKKAGARYVYAMTFAH